MALYFHAFGKQFDIVLQRSDEMFSNEFQIEVVTETGKRITDLDVFVHYRGRIKGSSCMSFNMAYEMQVLTWTFPMFALDTLMGASLGPSTSKENFFTLSQPRSS